MAKGFPVIVEDGGENFRPNFEAPAKRRPLPLEIYGPAPAGMSAPRTITITAG